MKVYLKLNNQFWTGKLSARGGNLKFVMTDSIGSAREFGSVDSALEYLNGWKLPTAGFVVEIDYGKPEQEEKVIYSQSTEEILSQLKGKYQDYYDFLHDKNRDREHITDAFDYLYQSLKDARFFEKPEFPKGVDFICHKEESYDAAKIAWKQYTKSARSISEICKESDSNRYDHETLYKLYHEVKRGNYLKYEKSFAMEHILEYDNEIINRQLKNNIRDRFTED